MDIPSSVAGAEPATPGWVRSSLSLKTGHSFLLRFSPKFKNDGFVSIGVANIDVDVLSNVDGIVGNSEGTCRFK